MSNKYDLPDEDKEDPGNGVFFMAESETQLSKKLVDAVGIDEKQAVEAIRLVQSYSGPIPLPTELAHYNEVSPGLGTDLARDYLTGREHDRKCDVEEIELAKQEASRKDNWLSYANRGQVYGFVSQAIFVTSAIVSMLLGHEYIAAAFIAPPALGVVGHFIQGMRRDDKSESPRS